MTVVSVGFTQDKYPSKPITFIMAVEAGADGDVLGRPLMDRVARILGQPITVINKPGAGSSIGYREIHQAKPDGYTLGWASATIITNKLQGVSPIDYNNFTHLGAFATFFPILIGSNKSNLKFNTIQEAIAYSKANPGKVNLATAGVGQSWWVGAQTFLTGTNLSMASIPVTGAGANVALLVAGGHAEVGVAGLASSKALLDGGQVRFLAALSENRAPPPYDKLPTVKELGYPVSWESTNIIIGPAGMPKDIVDNANNLLKELESARGIHKKIDLNDKKLQLSFFDVEDPVMKKITQSVLLLIASVVLLAMQVQAKDNGVTKK